MPKLYTVMILEVDNGKAIGTRDVFVPESKIQRLHDLLDDFENEGIEEMRVEVQKIIESAQEKSAHTDLIEKLQKLDDENLARVSEVLEAAISGRLGYECALCGCELQGETMDDETMDNDTMDDDPQSQDTTEV